VIFDLNIQRWKMLPVFNPYVNNYSDLLFGDFNYISFYISLLII